MGKLPRPDRSKTARARQARKQPSAAEARFWQLVRNGKLGFKIRREVPIDEYRLVFFCYEAMLAIELDGEQHDAVRDAIRDAKLRAHGIGTLRISNREFFYLDRTEAWPNVLERVAQTCEDRIRELGRNSMHSAPHPPAPSPVRPGEGEPGPLDESP